MRSRERMTSLRANKEVLISAPSILVCFEECVVSAPLSLPAKSMKLSFPSTVFVLLLAPEFAPKAAAIRFFMLSLEELLLLL